MIELVIGGARSGKSRYAEKEAKNAGSSVAYIATAEALDAEMSARIAMHQRERPDCWVTIEAPISLAEMLQSIDSKYDCILVDCLTLWLTNCLLASDAVLAEQRSRLLGLLETGMVSNVIFVTNEVGLGIVPDNALSRRFRDEAGWLNQSFAQFADRVTWCVAGIPQRIKDAND